MKIARFSTGDELRYGIVEGLADGDPAPSGESEGHLIVLKGDPLYQVPEATGEVVALARGHQATLPARSEEPLRTGADAVVLEADEGTLVVTSLLLES